LIVDIAAYGQKTKLAVLHIGTSGTLHPESMTQQQEDSAHETLRKFIKDETGLKSDFARQKNWQELAEIMAKGKVHLGVFQGYEFAWAQEKYSELKPLAVAINVHHYPVAGVVVKRDNPAKDFAGLQGQSLHMPTTGQRFLDLFVTHACQANGKEPATFFSKIIRQPSIEDALDDVVDGTVQACLADEAALEAYKRRKPGRFDKLKEVARSQPFPPAVVASYGKNLDDATLKRFRDALLGARRKEKGQTMLTIFHLTGFEKVPDDFGKVLAETRKTYRPPEAAAK